MTSPDRQPARTRAAEFFAQPAKPATAGDSPRVPNAECPVPPPPDFIGSALDAYGLRAAVLRAGPEASFARIGELRPALELAARAWAEWQTRGERP